MTLFEDLKWRGLIQDISNPELENKLNNETFVNFIKTSTGFGTEGAIVSDVRLINKYKNDILEIKAAGGIRTEEEIIDFIEAGATRIGTSHAVEIMDSCNHDHEEE